MSFLRFLFYSVMLGGWAAFLGWLICELLFLRHGLEEYKVALTAAVIGMVISGSLVVLAGIANGQLSRQIIPLALGLFGGFVGGGFGGLIAAYLYVALVNILPGFLAEIPRVLGWTIMGLAIGGVLGVAEMSWTKIRNGLIGGGAGGFLGGLLFGPISAIASGEMSSRATGFVILGLAIGGLIGLVQVVLKEAWITVLDGYRPGRQMILGQAAIVMGSAEYVAVPFLGSSGKNLEPEHARISRNTDGTYGLEDNRSKLGTLVNNQPIQGRVVLKDGDIIKLGSNAIQFKEKARKSGPAEPVAAKPMAQAVPVSAPPPPRPAPPPAAQPVPAAAVPVVAPPPPRPAAAPPPRPAAAPPPRPTPAAPPVKPAPASSAQGDGCPGCGRKVPGRVGQRFCVVCDRQF